MFSRTLAMRTGATAAVACGLAAVTGRGASGLEPAAAPCADPVSTAFPRAIPAAAFPPMAPTLASASLPAVDLVMAGEEGAEPAGERADAASDELTLIPLAAPAPADDTDLAEGAKRILAQWSTMETRGGFVHVDRRRYDDKTRWRHHLIHSTLRGEDKLENYDLWVHRATGEVRTRVRLGSRMCGHKTVVHGGAIATVLDDSFGACFFAAGLGTGFTAYLHVNFRRPVPPGADLALSVRVVRREGRKVFLEATVEEDESSPEVPRHPWHLSGRDGSRSDPDTEAAETSAVLHPTPDAKPRLYADANALFVVKAVPTTVDAVKQL